MVMPNIDAEAAGAALTRAETLQRRVRRRSRWYVRYLQIYGAGAFVATLLLGLGPRGVAASVAVWGAVVAALSAYAVRQPVSRHGFTRRHAMIIASWAVLYAAVLMPGVLWFEGELLWWLPGAVVVSLPAFLGARLEGRR